METESTKSSELSRNKIHRINKKQKNTIVLFLNTFLELIQGEVDYLIYLGGSQSKFSEKLPCTTSDIDIYIFIENFSFISGKMITFDENISEQIKLSLGMDINIYIVNKLFLKSVSQGMELLK